MAEQGASNGAGQAAGKSFVSFSRPAAQRIAKAVRTVEAGDRNQPGLTFDHPMPGGGQVLKVATFTGSWSKGSFKTVTLQGSTVTASVYNWCHSSDGNTADTASSQFVVFGRAGGTNSVLEISLRNTSHTCRMSIAGVNLQEFPGYSSETIQLLGHSAAGPGGTTCPQLTWYSITTCSTAT